MSISDVEIEDNNDEDDRVELSQAS
jgi:hypothetical protein